MRGEGGQVQETGQGEAGHEAGGGGGDPEIGGGGGRRALPAAPARGAAGPAHQPLRGQEGAGGGKRRLQLLREDSSRLQGSY